MSYTDYEFKRYGHYFADKWQFDKHIQAIDRAEYQLNADIEAARISLLDSSLSRRNHWFVVICVDGNRNRVKPLYGPFESPALAMAELNTVEKFVSIHARKYAAFSTCEIAAMPYQAAGLWNQEIDQFKVTSQAV